MDRKLGVPPRPWLIKFTDDCFTTVTEYGKTFRVRIKWF